MDKDIRNDYAIDALALEVDRRKPLKGRSYSYGHLVADTTPEERERIAERYRKGGKAGIRSGGVFKESDDEKDAKKASKHNPTGR